MRVARGSHRLALGCQQTAPIRVSDHLGYRLTEPILEFYRQFCVELEVDTASFSRAVLTKLIRKQVLEGVQDRKKNPVLII
ncbi:hypothetical protein DFAR_3630013 [Desulfarculales bacterium]